MLICFEGPNACGKSTIINQVLNILQKTDLKLLCVKTPTENELGTLMRTLTHTLPPVAMACLSVADKYECVENIILPKLKQGYTIINDRLTLSTYLYNAMDGVEFEYTQKLLSKMIIPDVTIVFKIDKQIIIDNLKSRTWVDRYEKRVDLELELLDKTIDYCKKLGHNIEEIYIDKNLEQNVKKVMQVVNKYISI